MSKFNNISEMDSVLTIQSKIEDSELCLNYRVYLTHRTASDIISNSSFTP
jgi:hypothetical protein